MMMIKPMMAMLCLCVFFSLSARTIMDDLTEEAAIEKICEGEVAMPCPVPEPFHWQPKPKQQVTEPYRIKIGDKFLISLYGEETIKQEIDVSPSGTLSFHTARFIPAVGRTIPEVIKDLEEGLKTYFRYPVITLTALELVGDHYTVIGEVALPGVKPLIGNITILSAISNAGGFTNRIYREQTIDLVDLDRSFLSRDGKYVPVDFTRLIKHGDTSFNLPIYPGDFIYMATYVMPKVYVLGEVFHTATINYIQNISLAEALAEAGGVTRRASSRVAVIRGALYCPQLFLIDINRILKGKACNFWLEPGDIVYVPPFRFTHFKDYIEAGIATFVGQLASIAGTNAFLEITPKAKGTAVISPVPVIGPVAPVAGPAAAPAAAP